MPASVTETYVTGTNDTTSATHTITGATIASGNLATVRFGYASDSVTISSIVDNAGNTWAVATSFHSGSGDNQTSAIGYSVLTSNISSGNIITITLSATSPLAADLAYFTSSTGWFPQATVLDRTSGFNTGSTTTWTSGTTAKTVQSEELLIACAVRSSTLSGGTSSPIAPWKEESERAWNAGGGEIISSWQYVSVMEPYTATGRWTLAEITATTIATFKMVPAAFVPYPGIYLNSPTIMPDTQQPTQA